MTIKFLRVNHPIIASLPLEDTLSGRPTGSQSGIMRLESPVKETRAGRNAIETAAAPVDSTPVGKALFHDGEREQNSKRSKEAAASASALNGVVAYVRARTRDGLDSSDHIARRLHALGAETLPSITGRVTHIVFHGPDGDLRLIMERARRSRAPGLPLPFFVAISWVQACYEEERRAIEHSHALSRAYNSETQPNAHAGTPIDSPSRLAPSTRTPSSGGKRSAKEHSFANTYNPSVSPQPASAPAADRLHNDALQTDASPIHNEPQAQAVVCIDSGGKHANTPYTGRSVYERHLPSGNAAESTHEDHGAQQTHDDPNNHTCSDDHFQQEDVKQPLEPVAKNVQKATGKRKEPEEKRASCTRGAVLHMMMQQARSK